MKSTKHNVITFLKDDDLMAVVLAELGRGNDYISRKTGLTTHQVQYRATKAKNIMGLGHGVGFRTAWRNGQGPFAAIVEKELVPMMRTQAKRVLPEAILHPPANS